MTINHVTVSGRLTRDAEMRYTGSGMAVGSFGIAVNERVKNRQTGEWSDRPNYFECTVFGKYAEAIKQRLTKGALVVVDGSLRYSSWDGQDGQKRSKVEIIANEVTTPAMPQQAATRPEKSQSTRNATRRTGYQDRAPKFEEVSPYDEEIPF